MKTLTSILLIASTLLATTAAAPSPSATYTLKIVTQDPKLNGTAVVLKDDSGTNTFPNPLGSFSTGNPRYPFNFTVTPSSEKDNLYEIKKPLSQKHVILHGDPIAPQLFETGLGSDPPIVRNKTITRTQFLISHDSGVLSLRGAVHLNFDGKYDGPGSWRACNGSTVDYQLYWFDGLSNLTALLGYCETVQLLLEEVTPSATSTPKPATTFVTSAYITGVPAPTAVTQTSSCDVSASILPIPSPTPVSQITIRIFNDQAGANAEASVLADGVPRSIPDLFRGKAIDNNGDIFGTSAQLVRFSDSTKCSLTNLNVPDWVFELDGRARNFADLDEDASKAERVWLNGFTFQCLQG
ncbi:hypothetical protein SLS61_009866 [Didymella pomorum]